MRPASRRQVTGLAAGATHGRLSQSSVWTTDKEWAFPEENLQLYENNERRPHSAKGSALQDNLTCLFKI